MEIKYILPNVSSFNLKGRNGLLNRYKFAKEFGCDIIEIPCDFIKNKTEVKLTGKTIGDFLDKHDIELIYKNDYIDQDIKYSLHTEPLVSRKISNNIADIKWYDHNWVNSLINMIIDLSKYFEKPAYIIEIHPGNSMNKYENIINFVYEILEKYNTEFNFTPYILLENRTTQFISTGKDIYNLWNYITKSSNDILKIFGIILDIQQLYTKTKDNFITEYDLIPFDFIKGFHIHCEHKMPTLSDNIPWKYVFDKIKSQKSRYFINPEIHHLNKVNDTINFIKGMMSA